MVKRNYIRTSLQKHAHFSENMVDDISKFTIIKKNKIERFVNCEKRDLGDKVDIVRISTNDEVSNGNFSKKF